MDRTVFPWFSWFGNKREGRGLEWSNNGFQFFFRERTDVSSFLKFFFHNFFIFCMKLINRWIIGGNICSRYARDTKVETVHKAIV